MTRTGSGSDVMALRIPRSALVVALAIAVAPPAVSQERPPLLVEGKTTVFQRVLAKPEARLHAEPGGTASGALRTLQPLYVYERRDDWIEVGRGRATGAEGWLPVERTVPWTQNIVVSFANPANRERQLIFESEDALMEVLYHESSIGTAEQLRRDAIAGGADGVVSIEPEEHVDITENFYLFPILDWRIEEHPMTFELMRVVEVASLPLEESAPLDTPETPPTAGLVFAIDTTRSMQPYIEATRQAVADIVAHIGGSEIGEHVRFGAVGFRDSPDAARSVDPARDLEYRTRVFLPLERNQRPETVLARFGDIREARDSTVGFHEDSLAAVVEGIGFDGWETSGAEGEPIRMRYLVVVSDASPKPPRDPNALYNYDAEAVRQIALSKGVTLVAIHLKTPDGRPNHAVAEQIYRDLTRTQSGAQSAYYEVDLGGGADPSAVFRPVVDRIVEFVSSEYERRASDLQETRELEELDPLEEASLAMRLAWLGRDRSTGVPEIIEGWAIDRALENPLVPALDVRLLVTKNQLSTMADVLREILAIGQQTQGEMREGEFFELLRGALARIAQDPNSLVTTDIETLDEAIGEFLGELPYQSPILANVTADKWATMGSQRRAILDRVEARLMLYEHFHDDPDNWTALYDGAPEGEHVFAMPFEALP